MTQSFDKIYLFSPECKAHARTLVAQAVAKKEITIPRRCECCFYDSTMLGHEESILNLKNKARLTKALLEAHHYNYNYPTSVWWLCATCHKMLHVIQRKLRIACLDLAKARLLVNQFRYDYEHAWINEINDDEDDWRFEELYF